MNDLFLRACRGETVERLPVWIMRQAGRYLPQFRAIRSRNDFLTVCKTPELATEVTLQPIDAIGVDAAILFADILLPLEAMGAELRFEKGVGPVFPKPVRNRAGIDDLIDPDVEATLGYVFAALRMVRRELNGRVPAIGFAGTPWTLSTYLVEGGTSKQFSHLLAWSYRDPEGLSVLLNKIADVTIPYLQGQIEAGAQALQLFDSWGGLLSEERWRRVALPPLMRIIEGIQRGEGAERVPLIFYVNNGAHLLPAIAELPVDVLSVDWRVPLSQVRAAVGPDKVLQGNLDPATLLGPVAGIEEGVTRMLAQMPRSEQGIQGHVANLGHGIMKETPVEHAAAFVEAVQRLSATPEAVTS